MRTGEGHQEHVQDVKFFAESPTEGSEGHAFGHRSQVLVMGPTSAQAGRVGLSEGVLATAGDDNFEVADCGGASEDEEARSPERRHWPVLSTARSLMGWRTGDSAVWRQGKNERPSDGRVVPTRAGL